MQGKEPDMPSISELELPHLAMDAPRFAENAAKLGYKMLVDLTKYAFGFHFDAKRRQGYPKEQWAQTQQGQSVTWTQPDGSTIVWT